MDPQDNRHSDPPAALKLDASGTIRYASAGWSALAGGPSPHGRPYAAALHPAAPAAFAATLLDVLHTGLPTLGWALVGPADGPPRAAAVDAMPDLDPATGAVRGAHLTLRPLGEGADAVRALAEDVRRAEATAPHPPGAVRAGRRALARALAGAPAPLLTAEAAPTDPPAGPTVHPDLATLLTAAAAGDLGLRLSALAGSDPGVAAAHELLDVVERVLHEVARVLDAAVDGLPGRQVDPDEAGGVFREVLTAARRAADTLTARGPAPPESAPAAMELLDVAHHAAHDARLVALNLRLAAHHGEGVAAALRGPEAVRRAGAPAGGAASSADPGDPAAGTAEADPLGALAEDADALAERHVALTAGLRDLAERLGARPAP